MITREPATCRQDEQSQKRLLRCLDTVHRDGIAKASPGRDRLIKAPWRTALGTGVSEHSAWLISGRQITWSVETRRCIRTSVFGEGGERDPSLCLSIHLCWFRRRAVDGDRRCLVGLELPSDLLLCSPKLRPSSHQIVFCSLFDLLPREKLI